jgi:hypothetical protein
MTTKCPKELKIKIEEYIHGEYHFDDKKWNDDLFVIIDKYYEEHPISNECEWSNCHNKRKQHAVNGAGDIVYSLCEEHLKWYKKHVKSFQLL